MKHLLPDFRDLTLAEQVAQLIVVRASGHLFDHEIRRPDWEPKNRVLRTWLRDVAFGGVIFADGSAAEIALRSQELQDLAKVPLLLAADVEEGVGQRFSGATSFPPPMALGQIAKTNLEKAQHYARLMGHYTAEEAVAIGLNWILAPVMDVNTNPANPVINVRSFSDDPKIASHLAIAFTEGTRQHAVMTTAKHFPGHGDTGIDSHVDLPVLPHGRARFDEVELVPFKAAIAVGVDSIMTAHLSIPALDPMYPATLSDRVLTKLLRQELGYKGLIVTDALVMKAIAKHFDPGEAAVLAIEAGADLLMMPENPPATVEAICGAVEEGRIPEDRILASLERVWQAKQKVTTFGVDPTSHQHAWEQQMPSPICLDAIAQPSAFETVREIITATQQVQGQITERPEVARTVIVVDSLLECEFLSRTSPAIAAFQSRGYEIQLIDRHGYKGDFGPDQRADWPTVLQIFARSHPEQNRENLSVLSFDWLEFLLARGTLQGLLIYGNPHILKTCLDQLPPNIPYGFSYGHMAIAQACVLEAFFLSEM